MYMYVINDKMHSTGFAGGLVTVRRRNCPPHPRSVRCKPLRMVMTRLAQMTLNYLDILSLNYLEQSNI